jgi:hypothetical protein
VRFPLAVRPDSLFSSTTSPSALSSFLPVIPLHLQYHQIICPFILQRLLSSSIRTSHPAFPAMFPGSELTFSVLSDTLCTESGVVGREIRDMLSIG